MMNLVEILRQRIDELESGDHLTGLRFVLQHIEMAFVHLERGSSSSDDRLFTDAIYRTNQAFEGSLKEAYRVLADKDPTKVTPYDIENFFQSESVLRPRVLKQFTWYRKEWRNPSTHEYSLDFNDDEALLAIVSVCAFAIALTGQIKAKQDYTKGQATAPAPILMDDSRPLVDAIADALVDFQPHAALLAHPATPLLESDVVYAIAGYLSVALPDAKIETEVPLSPSSRRRIDILIEHEGAEVFIEVRRGRRGGDTTGLSRVLQYMALSRFRNAILYSFDRDEDATMVKSEYSLPGVERRVVSVVPVV